MAGFPQGNALKTLSLRALVAYATRSAMRVNPYFYIPGDPAKNESAESALRIASEISLAFVHGDLTDWEIAQQAEEDVVQALMDVSAGESPDTKAALSCNAAYAAINATTIALCTPRSPSRATEGTKVVAAAITSAEAALVIDPDIRFKVIRDYQSLVKMSLGRFPDFGRAFDAGERGSLGPLQLTRDAEQALKRRSLLGV